MFDPEYVNSTMTIHAEIVFNSTNPTYSPKLIKYFGRQKKPAGNKSIAASRAYTAKHQQQ